VRTLVIGAGSTGGYFGGRLAEAGRDVTFLVRPRRAAVLRESGLVVSSPHGDFRLAPKLVTADELADDYDLVLLTVKAYALEQALADFAPAIGEHTVILPFLNGMRHVDVLTGRFGERAVLGGVCFVSTALEADGSIRQLSGMQQLIHGDRQEPGSARARQVDAELNGAGFPARLSEDIVTEMWEKWVFLASIGAVTCLMRAPVGDIVAAPGGREFAEGVVGECVAVATASGQRIGDATVQRTLATVTEEGSAAASSMYRDLVQGAPVEADQIIGDLIGRAEESGVDVPLLRVAYTALSVYQNSVAG
jgi:2-dehydropantoate 2-reductase